MLKVNKVNERVRKPKERCELGEDFGFYPESSRKSMKNFEQKSVMPSTGPWLERELERK